MLPEAGPDAAIDASADAEDGSADVSWMPGCSAGMDGGALGAPQAIATGRQDPSYVGASSDGPVWTEVKYYDEPNGVTERSVAVVWLPYGKSPTFSIVEDLCPFEVTALRVRDEHLAYALEERQTWCGYLVSWSRLDGSGGGYWEANSNYGLDDSYVYMMIAPCLLTRMALDEDAGAASFDQRPGVCGIIAVDQNALYLMDWEVDASVRYSIKRISHWGDAPHVLADNVPGPASHMGFQADDGAVFWQVDKSSRIYELPAGSSTPRILVDDPDGVWGFTVDHDYVYWASGEGWKAAQGTVKRIRRCGGTPEVIAQGQRWSAEYRDPVGISVGADALYWVTGDGKIMRIRKLDAPDAGIDTASDASTDVAVDAAGDASVNASPDAGFDASIDAGVE